MVHIKPIAKDEIVKRTAAARYKVQLQPLRCLVFVIQIRKYKVQLIPPLQHMVKNALQVLYISFNVYIIRL